MYIYYKIYKSMRRGRIHGEKNMRNSRTKTQTKLRNYIKLTAGALLLAITFVLVFAGTLSGAFGIENELQQNGTIESNVASAANVFSAPSGATTGTIGFKGNQQNVNNYLEKVLENARDIDNNWGWNSANRTGNGKTYKHENTYGVYQYSDRGTIEAIVYVAVKLNLPSSKFYTVTSSAMVSLWTEGGGSADVAAQAATAINGSSKTPSFTYPSAQESSSSTTLVKSESSSHGAHISVTGKNSQAFGSGWENSNAKITSANSVVVKGNATVYLFAMLRSTDNRRTATTSRACFLDSISFTAEEMPPFDKGSGTLSDPFLLEKRADFDKLSSYVLDGETFSDVYFKIQPDTSITGQSNGKTIEMGSSAFTPIGYYGTSSTFKGNIDGNGCTIKGLKVDLSIARAGFIGALSGGSVKNLTIDSTSTIKSSTSDAAGIVGYMTGGIVENCLNYAMVSGGKQNGGVVANVNNDNAIIRNCKNYGAVSGTALIGGIVGYLQNGTIQTCSNSGKVTATGGAVTLNSLTGAYLGGIVGYANGNISNCYNEGEVTTGTSWGSSNIVGGIAGYVASGKKIEYCYVSSKNSQSGRGGIEGSSMVGGIVGANYGTVNFCYFDGTIKGLWTSTDAMVGYICGNSNGKITNSWRLPGSSTLATSNVTYQENGYKFSTELTLVPAVVSGDAQPYTYNVTANNAWTDILTTDINGFKANANAQDGYYLSSTTTSNGSTGVLPTIVESNAVANAVGQTRKNSVPVNLTYVYSATIGNDIYVATREIGQNNLSATTYTGKSQGIAKPTMPSSFAINSFYFTHGNANDIGYESRTDVGTYDIITDISVTIGTTKYVVGRKVHQNTWTIEKKTLSIEPRWSTDMSNGASKAYNGAQQGLLSFTVSGFVENESVAGGHAAFNVTPTICTVANPSSGSIYTIGTSTNVSDNYRITIALANSQNYKMDLSVAYSWKITKRSVAIIDKSYFYGANIVTDPVFETQNGDNGLVNGHIVTGWIADVTNKGFDWLYGAIDSSGSKSSVFKFSNIVINNDNVITSNYKIDTEYTLTINEGDFGVYGTTDIEKNPWGSPHNPYVIGTKEQLTRLSAIVGGTSAVNSIKNDTYVYVQAQSGDYSGAYFKLADNIPSVGNITPIGSNTHSFAGNFDGNNKTISGLNISVAGNNVGLFGYISGATIKNLTVNGSVKGSSNVGGVVGYANGTNIKNATNNASVEGDTSVGGIVGYADSTSRMYGTIVNSGNITANSMVGGVSGENHGFWCDTNSNYGTFKNSGSINGRNGATVGGVTAFADKEMRNAFNTGNVIGGNAVGGVAGRVQALIKNSYNSGEIVGTNSTAQGEISGTPTGVFVGGITGYTTVNGTISNCYNKGHIAAHSASGDYINNGDYVGGIVGFAQAKVEYCANIGGLIEGNNFIGGIVGSALDNTNIDYCYDVQGQRKFRWDGCNHGSITGSGGNVTNSWAINEKQVQTTANNPNPVVSTKGYRLTTAFAVTPQVDLQNTTNQKWEDILSSKINGFKVVGSVGKNQFFCSDNGSDTNTKYVKPSKTEGFAGDNGDVTTWYSATIASNIRVRVQNITLPTIGSKEYDGLAHGFGHTTYPNTANGAAANNPIVYTTEFLYVGTTYKENLNVSPTNVDVYNTTVTIKIDGQIVGVKKGDTVTITERLLKVSNVWTSASEHVAGDTSNVYIFHYNTQHQGIIENGISVASVHGEFAIPQDVYTIGGYVETKQAHNDTTHTRTFTLNDIRNYKIENKYSQYDDFSPNTVLTEDTSDRGISEATVGDTIVVTYTWKIVPYSLATNITSGNVWFGGRTDLIVGNQGIANVNVGNQSYADKRFYPLQSAQTGVQKVLVYAQHNYAADKFVLYVKYNNGTVAVLTQGTEYTLSALDAPTVENPTPLNTSVTASGTGNFSGNITKWYTALFSDFGWKDGKTPEDNDWGGSADNPYVISKPEHLLRLSQIVNGGMAWNSIQNTVTAGVCIAPQTTAKATSRDYNDAYFLVTVDIDMSGYISTDGVYNFLPIGTRSTQNQTELPFSATFDGGDNTITYVYNVGSFYNVDGARTNYVGLFGYLNGATISNLKVASNGGLSITDNDGIVGIEYVGGIAGCAVDSTLYNTVLAYGGWVRGENYVGGIVGYGERITIESSEAVSSANVGGETYVGGIVGKWIVSNQNQIGGSFAGQAKITLPSGQQIHGVKYVGGLVGWLDTSSCTSKVGYTPQLNNNGEKVGVYGTEYVGALFGALIGNGYHQNATNDKYTAIVIDKDASDNFKVGNVKVILQNLNDKSASGNAKVVGGLVGYAEGVGICFNTDWTTSNVTLDTGNYTPSFIGGIAGVLGKNATIEAIYNLKADGTFLSGGMHTITNNTELGASGNLMGSFVGGIVGYVSSQAGVYWETGTTIFGNGISLVNSATIYATSYAGGIFGALGDIPESVAKDFESDSILYKVLTTGVREGSASTTLGLAPTVSGNGITAQGRLVNNASISVSGSYVGGIAGYGGAKVRFVLRNTPQDSAIDVSKLNIYSGGSDIFINGSYAGGIAGYLVDNLEHELQYIVVQAKFDSANAKRVGGLVGYMGSGKVERCVVTSPDGTSPYDTNPDGTSPDGTISATTDNGNYQGSEYVGGLVGETQNAIIRNSVSTGFNLDKTTNTKGGLLGGGTNPTIESSWTFYIANSGATYSTVSKNAYGKYILVDSDIIVKDESSYPTFAKLCEFTGITKNGTAGVLEFAVNVPSQRQLVFYNASGSDTETSNKESFKGFDNSNNVLTIKLDMASGTSMQICLLSVRFVNVPKCSATSTEQDKIDIVEATYVKPSNSTRYHVKATTADFDTTGTSPTYQVTHIVANIFFDYNGDMVYIGTAESSEKTGSYDSGTLTPGHETNPYTISTRQEWEDFAASVNDGSFKQGSYVKLLNDITISTLAGNSSNSFSGTFDGNGHTINLGTRGDNADGTSLFPYAYSAVFRNLSIDGTITNTSREGLAGFVGIAKGKLEFYNCTNNVKVTAFRNAAGFTGFVSTYDIIFTSCVNNGDIETKEGADNSEDSYSPIYYTYGTGGIIACIAISGNSARSFTIKSCINNGNITAPVNVGGIVGKISGNHSGDTISARCDLYMYDCANTGEIYSNQKLTDSQAGAFWDFTGDNKYYGRTVWCNAGGLVGIVFKSAAVHIYSSYNRGYIHGIGNVVGGLVGSIGDHNGQTYRTPNSRAMYPSEIYYCFNTGRVEVGYDGVNTSNGINIWGKSGDKYCSAVVGGLVGVMSYGTIAYSYNTGTVDCWGGVGVKAAYNSRAGGIIGESTANAQVNWTRNVTVKNCYNVGQINVYTKEDARYASGIVGYMDADNAVNNTHVSNCYSVTNAVYYRQTNIYIDELIFGGDEKWTISGTLSDLSGLTAKMNDKGVLTTTFAEGSGNDASIESLTNDTKYRNGTAKGYIYIYGCLPQLAVFALDTHDALSMRSVGFGQDQYGEFNNEAPQNTGSETYPYIIRDGIGLLGVQALVDLGYDFDNEYIEFANSTNNIKADGSTSSNSPLVCTSINMPKTDEQNTYLSATAGYYMSSSNGVTYNQAGKSYHLFALGAVCRSTPGKSGENSNDSFNWWIGSNHYYNGAYGHKEGAYKDYGTFKTQNFITIGRNGNVFKGSISGKQVDNDNLDKPVNTVINNLRITSGQTIGGAYGGLFGHVENAYIGYIEVGGESNIWAYSSDNQQIAATGAIAGYVTGDSIIEHCAVSGTTAIGAYGKNDDTHIASDITYAGGIVGLADPKQGSEYKAGISVIIKVCTVNISTTTGDRAAFAGIIQACKSNIGGVLGYIEGIGHIKVDGDDKDYGASGKSNSVRIEGCEVQKAAIQAASSATESSHIGGVLGYGSEFVAAFITGCKVGNGADTVTIKGEHSLGGIAGGMSNAKGGYIDSCTVGAKTSIERINQGGDKDDKGNDKVSENPDHGTAIGGFVGFTEKSTNTTSPLTTTFSGKSSFLGKIKVTVGTTNPGEHGDKKPVDNVGGIVGDMGSGANFASGSDVTVRGTIDIKNNQGDWLAAANVGGVVGRTNKATFIGKFNVAPNMSTENAENVGGFIGKNIGTVYILADTTDKLENTTVDALNGTNITIGGTIKGTSEVGGFIGVNNSGSTLNIGSNIANAKAYKSGTLKITITASVTGSHDNVGGIVGKNEGVSGQDDYAIVDIVKGTIKQNGAIKGANNVGGIIGLNDGLLTTGGGAADTTIGGVTLSEEQQNEIKNLSINNTGSVTGTGDYVGGVVGKLDSPATLSTEDSGKGAIAGTFTNSGDVSGGKFVGGSLGYVGKNVTITAKGSDTVFTNTGTVTATGYYAGGSIGALVGKIEGVDNGHTVNFKNTGTVTATGFVGGSIGVLAGPVKYAQFVNSSGNLSIAAVNAVGGSVGFIGVPTPLETILTGVGITLADDYVKVENTHFEASGELTANPDSNAISVAKDAATNKSTGWGGVGGAIGVIGKNVRWGTEQNKNTYYANGNVTANGINNVGGIVGIILAENVNISNMLAYNTTVKGGENVGGIVGATDGIGTVITSAYAIEGTFTGSKNVGGIIGLAKTDTDASTSYWVKGYTNAILAGTDVKNLQQDLGKFETIIEYVGEQPIVFTEEFCKMYTPKTYYDDYPGTHTYNGKTITLGENVEQLTWYDYFKDKLGETSAQIKNGAWVKPIANAPTYTTGANNTGWYFVYATDKTIGTINAEHSTNANLQYWKRIADAYTSSERNEGKDDNVKNPLASDIVLGNGAPQKSTLYATATAAGTESGYYLYMATSGKSRPSATNQGNKFYIQTLTTNADALAENVAVYYRTISKGKALTFNGYLRYAPVGITASEGETVSYIKNPETATGKPNSYCYSADTTTAGGQGTDGAQTNPGSFHSQVNIYYFDSEGKPHVVGGVAIGWTINKRDLTAEFTANTDRTYGEDRKQEGDGTVKHDMKLVVGNIAPKAGKNAGIVITISSDNESYTFTWDGTRFDKTSAGGIVISAEGMTDPGVTNGWDASDSLYNVTEPDDKQTKDFSCFIDFTNAKTYTISVTTTATSGAQYTLDKTTNFSVKQATLTLKGVPTTNNPDSVIFDNKTHAFSWKVEGFKYNDDISQLALFSPTAYALGKSAPLFNSGTPNTMKTGSVTIDGVENVTYTIYSNSNSIDISGARDKGEYYIAFATLSAGNYKLKLDKGVESLKQSIKLSISDNKLTFDWRGAGGSHPYDKKTKGTITLTITAKSAIDGFENFVKKFFAPTMSGTGANAVWGTASDNKSITITFTTGVNAGTYTATIAQNKNETAFIEANKVNCSYPMIPQSRSYEIDKRNLTITLISKDNKTSYTYNGQHQGLVSIRVNSESGSTGLISGDSVNATVSVSREGTEFGSISVSAITSSTANNVRLSTINFGKYIATVTMAENTNYTCQQSGTLEWEIKKYQLTLSDLTGGQKVYDGIATKPTLKVNGVSVDNGEFTPSGVSGDRIAIKYSASIDGQSYESIVNAGKYSVSIGGNGANAITVSPATRDGINTADNYSIEGGQSVDYIILPRTLKLSWQEIQSFVFSNTEQGLIVVGVEGVEDGGNGSLAVKSGTSTINGVKLTGYAGGDTIAITIIGALLHANSTSKMEAKITSVSGTNKDGSNSIEGNYTLSEDDRFSGEFTITPSVVSIKFNAPNATLTKVYDGNRTVPTSQINDSYFSWSATGHNPTRNPFKVTAQYDNKNVGDKKAVTFSYTFTDPTNVGDYVVGTVDGSAYTVGQITPAHIRVALDKLRSGKATRTYTDDEFYGGAEGATGNGRSKTYRTGEGFTVSGVLGSDNINVVARYQEADNTRNSNSGNYFDFSKYVNDVYKDADGTFKKASAGKYFKKLVFTMTGTDAANYTFNVYDSSAEGGNKYSESDSTAAAIQSVTVYDSRDSKNKNAIGAASIQIEITVKSVRVEYSDTAQSYANDDNTYNTDWKPITGTNKDMDKADAKIKVSNGWMYADGKDHTAEEGYTKREYRGYTTIRGSQNSERLGAKVDPTNGMDLNYRLSNQPTLTIAYFVSTGDEYEINSLARLLIASFYYTASQNPGNLEIIKIVSSGYKWVSVVSADDYDKGEFELPQDTPITDSKATTWDEYFTELEAKGYSVFLNIEANAQDNIPANTWGYYATTTSESSTIPTSYKLTKDIVGKFTESDISILNTFFTVIGDDGKTTTSTWSGNGTYLKNVLKAAEGKIATINGSLFVSTAKTEEAGDVTGFGGTFDGNGYVIEYLNIMGYGKDNVGLFDVIGANGIVKNLHLRNVTINVNAKYVGGIAGKVLAAADALTEKSVKNVSFHGSINVTGSTDQSVGGLFGISERAVENAIVLGLITVSNVNAKVGGVVGSSEQGMSNVVSLMQIDANCNVGAFSQTNTNVTNSYHLQNAVWRRNGSSITFVNHANAKTYDELMSGSVSGYGTTNKYYHESETSVTKGEYDVLDDVVLTKISVDNKENARQSMRLADIVKVYLLMYSLNETQATDSGNLNGANVYAISTSSWLVGTADGTTAKPIAIANKQNVSLLRELRFASFTLKANVSIEIASTFSGAFYGSVTSATNESGTSYGYKITCDKAMFEAYSNDTTAWLSVQ